MRTQKKLLLLLGLLPILNFCTKDRGGVGVCFEGEIKPIFVSNCTMSGCHNPTDSKAGYDLTNYDGIMKGISPGHPLLSEVYNSIRGANPSMPESPHAKLSSKEVTLIRSWIKLGAKNTSNCSAACDSAVFSYNGRIAGIMSTWCTGCHNSSNASGGFDLSSYNPVKQAGVSGKLLGSIEHAAGYIAMPQNSGSLSDCDVNAIKKWINTGYPEN